jgi:membrane-bound lytic murein transglycosylase D
MVAARRALRIKRNACRVSSGRLADAVASLLVLATMSWPAPSSAAPTPDDLEHVGPLRVSSSARDRVRGGRPERASIHVAWAAGIDNPDRENADALRAFEHSSFVPGTLHKTIIDTPSDAWMRRLRLPDLPVRWNTRTVEYLRWFKDDPKGLRMMRAWMQRAGRYETRLRKILREVGVPEDLVYVALAESGFNPRVRSRVGAAGLWQFMEGTGDVYGLRRNYWVDERFDIERSTHAAALYLEDLRTRFGSWELALAAYNAGYGLVMTSIDRHNTNNFWALCEIESGLPYATTNYVPKIIAAALVGKNRKAFGVGADQVDPYPAVDWVEVQVSQSTALQTIASAIEVEPELLAELNAHLIRKRTPPERGLYAVKIPSDKRTTFETAKGALQAAWRSETTHTVRHGETLEVIARNFGTTPRELRRLNGVQDAAELTGGVVIVVPVLPANAVHGQALALEPVHEHGERDDPNDQQEMRIAAVPPLDPGTNRRLVFFETTRATTPRTLEEAFGVRFSEVVAWNDLDPHARLQSGQILQIVVDDRFDPTVHGVLIYEPDEVVHVARGSAEHIGVKLQRRGLSRRGYAVKKGDDLEKVGRRFDLSVGDLARINAFSRDHGLTVDDVIVVYVPPTKLRMTVDPPAPRTPFDAAIPVAHSTIRLPSTPTTSRVPGSGPVSRPTQEVAPDTDSVSRPTEHPPVTRQPSPMHRAPTTPSTSRVPGARRGSSR